MSPLQTSNRPGGNSMPNVKTYSRLTPTSRTYVQAAGNESDKLQVEQASAKREDPFFSVSSPTLSGPEDIQAH